MESSIGRYIGRHIGPDISPYIGPDIAILIETSVDILHDTLVDSIFSTIRICLFYFAFCYFCDPWYPLNACTRVPTVFLQLGKRKSNFDFQFLVFQENGN